MATRKDDAGKRIEKLREQIHEHNYRYHVLSRPTVSDQEYDKLFNELKDLEAAHPDLVSPDSPTQRVGAPVEGVTKVAHAEPMLSLDNAYGEAELTEWHDSLKSFLKATALDSDFVSEPKLDGVSIEVVYEDGRYTQASTRGDGWTGEDVTHNVKTIASLPQKLRGAKPPRRLELRGEVVMTKKAFARVNKQLLDRGEEPFANPRNLASGTLKQLDPRTTANRPLDVVFYGLGRCEGFSPATQIELLDGLGELGLPTNLKFAKAGDLEAMIAAYRDLLARRADLDFEIDGMVVKIDSMKLRERLGLRSRSPRWAVAVKFPALQGSTRVRDIVVQVGRLGTLTPVALLEPVEVGGVTVQRATLHNEDQIKKLDVKIGDHVFIERAGDVIPKVSSVIKEKRTGREKPFRMPKQCPECGTAAVKDEDGVAIRCPNPTCRARVLGSLEHFVSRGALALDGFGPKLIEQLVGEGLVKRVSDLWRLTKDDLLPLERMGEKSATKLTAALAEAKRPALARFLFGLGIEDVGETVAELLAEHFSTLDALARATEDELIEVKGIGPEVAASIVRWFGLEESRELLADLRDLDVEPKHERRARAAASGPFAGKTVLFTGTLASGPRHEAEERVERKGGRILKAVSKNLDFLVAGESPGSKLKKAKDRGVRVLTEDEFLKLVGE